MIAAYGHAGDGNLHPQILFDGNNPEEVSAFHDQDMSDIIDKATVDPLTQSYREELFYPTEPELLREVLKNEMQVQLGYDRWPSWFARTPGRTPPSRRRRGTRRLQLPRTPHRWASSGD